MLKSIALLLLRPWVALFRCRHPGEALLPVIGLCIELFLGYSLYLAYMTMPWLLIGLALLLLLVQSGWFALTRTRRSGQLAQGHFASAREMAPLLKSKRSL